MSPVPADPGPAGSLRERKKARTRHAIQAHALALFRHQGYEATTVEQIIERAEVSESTFYRYFPTKASVVLEDGYDPLLAAAFRAQPAGLTSLDAVRGAMRRVFGQMTAAERAEQHDRMALSLSVPELRASALDQLAEAMQLLAELVGERSGRGAGDRHVRTLAGAVVGVAIAVMFSVAQDDTADLAALMDESLAALGTGLDL
jgi:AcrR family transcriptional regulator